MKGITNTKRMLGMLVTLTALLAIAAPVAQADPWQFEQRNIERTQPIGDATDRQPASSPLPSNLASYDSFRRGQSLAVDVTPTAGNGRDWTSVGLGAGLGVALLLAGLAAAAARGRGRVAHS